MSFTPNNNDPLFGNPASDLLRGALESGSTGEASHPSSERVEWVPPTVTHLGEMLPAYHVQSLLGRGGMGAVYRAVQRSLNRSVAIKLLPAELAASADFMVRFEREAQTLAKLQHPGIVSVHDFGRTTEGHLYFVMEFVDGTDLQQVIHSPGLSPDQALDLTLQICESLQYAHSQGVVHRDIKPANVLMTLEGRAKLADFGLARPLSSSSGLTVASLVIGTPEYMAPEQWAGMADHRADIYALGVMLYEMLTGARPQGIFDLPSIKSHVDVRLDEVVVKAMRQAPEQRYQNVSELRDAVASIRSTPAPLAAISKASQQPAPPQPRPPVRQHPATASRKFWLWVALLGMLVVCIGIFGPNLLPPTEPPIAIPTVTPAPDTIESVTPVPPPVILPPSSKAPTTELSPTEATRAPTQLVLPLSPPDLPVATASLPSAKAQLPQPLTTTSVSLIEVFARESQNLIAWALAPLEDATPPDIRQNLTFIREDLIDEGKTKPTVTIDAYRAAYYLCEDLLTALNERDKARAAAGYRAAQATANQSSSNQALDARRNYLMSWPQYEREQSQRSALTQQNQARTAVATEAQKVAWNAISTRLRTTLDTRYRAFRAALRQ